MCLLPAGGPDLPRAVTLTVAPWPALVLTLSPAAEEPGPRLSFGGPLWRQNISQVALLRGGCRRGAGEAQRRGRTVRGDGGPKPSSSGGRDRCSPGSASVAPRPQRWPSRRPPSAGPQTPAGLQASHSATPPPGPDGATSPTEGTGRRVRRGAWQGPVCRAFRVNGRPSRDISLQD